MNQTIRQYRNHHPVASEEEKHAKISIWWDIDNCPVPRTCTPHCVINNIMQALRRSDFMGEIFIFIFGDSSQINGAVEAQLNRAGLTINHVPGCGGNDAVVRKMIVQMLLWAYDNPSPANILLISGDDDFWRTLRELKYLSYNVMLAHRRPNLMRDPPTDIIWEWRSLLSGDLPQPILAVPAPEVRTCSTNMGSAKKQPGRIVCPILNLTIKSLKCRTFGNLEWCSMPL